MTDDRHRGSPGERQTLKVAGGSNATAVAGALFKYIQEGSKVELVAIGAGAVNQMMKALCIGRGMAAQSGMDLSFVCGFSDEMVGGELKTAIKVFVRTT